MRKIDTLVVPLPDGLHPVLELVDRILSGVGNVTHTFMATDLFRDLIASDPAAASKVYWYEVLARVHISAHLSLLRTNCWLSGIDAAWRDANVLLYAAAARGLLESSADSLFTFRNIPMTLATHHYQIGRALRGKSKKLMVITEIEDALIHFTHARRLVGAEKKVAPKAHDAMTIQSYLRSYGTDYERVAAFYDRLCAFTHPAAESLTPFVEDYEAGTWRLTQRDQKDLVADLHKSFFDVFSDTLLQELNFSVTLLKLLNTFNDVSVHTRGVERIGVPTWKKLEEAIEASSAIPLPRPRPSNGST